MTEAKDLLNQFSGDEVSMDEMSPNFLPVTTGLPFSIWVRRQMQSKENVASLKVGKEGNDASVSIEEPVRVLAGKVPPGGMAKLTEYIRLNRDLLMEFWFDRGDLTDEDYRRRQQSLD